MAVYAIGDLQGCFDELNDILNIINFNSQNDQLWFVGDLVNRGPQSLEALRFVKQLGDNAITVLGNHDLHLLAVAKNTEHKRSKDTLDTILNAPDKNELMEWLCHRPLFHHDAELGYTLIHAGLHPRWNLDQASELAEEIVNTLNEKKLQEFLDHMYGNTPDKWSNKLTGWKRLRFIINCFTRLRFCDEKGYLALEENGPPGSQAKPYKPWFTIKSRKTKTSKIIFGHWSTIRLGNISDFTRFNVYPLDTGCVWGQELTALRLEDEKWFSVPSRQKKFKFKE